MNPSMNPERFDFRNGAKEWPQWISHFESYRIATRLDNKAQRVQVRTLLFHMGKRAEELFRLFNLDADEQDSYNIVRDRFDAHFVRRRNVIYERARFNQRVQKDGESAEDFIAALYTLSEYCAFRDFRDEMIRDRIVIGHRDHELLKKLQLRPDLTLDDAITLVRQHEEVERQQTVVRSQTTAPPPAPSLEAVATPPRSAPRRSRPKQAHQPARASDRKSDRKQQQQPAAKPTSKAAQCGWCGNSPSHPRANIPASTAECAKCHKQGHYARACRSTQAQAVRELNQSADELTKAVTAEFGGVFLGELSEDKTTARDTPWLVPLRIGPVPVVFKIDTGADVTAIPESLYRMAFRVPLSKSSPPLSSASGHALTVIGRFNDALHCIDRTGSYNEPIYVVKNLRTPLLSRKASIALSLVQRLEALDSSLNVRQEFSALFRGLGKIPGEYTIALYDDAKPFSILAPRRVPIPLLPAVKAELARIERLGVIFKVDEPTEWCAGMVLIPKPRSCLRRLFPPQRQHPSRTPHASGR